MEAYCNSFRKIYIPVHLSFSNKNLNASDWKKKKEKRKE